MKYGKGDPTKRRGAWVFGGIQRGEGGAAFMAVCTDNKRTKEALWPIIEENKWYSVMGCNHTKN